MAESSQRPGGPEGSAALARVREELPACRAAWPGLPLSELDLVAAVEARLASSSAPSAALRAMNLPDVYLAVCCEQKIPAALLAFEREVLPRALLCLPRLDPSRAFADDVAQVVREKLFTSSKRPARIAEYSGSGSLVAWVQAVVLRTALNFRHQTAAVMARRDQALEAPAAAGDVELDFIKSRYRAEFTLAFSEAMANLKPRERTLLRLHVTDKLSADQIATLYRVHRATVARWLSAARSNILEETRRRLGELLKLDQHEVDSLIALVRSQLDVSIDKLLRDSSG